MKADTKLFGTIDIDDEKIITLAGGMIGFPELQKFTLIYDEEKKEKPCSIMWLQSMDEPDVAFPVINPNEIKEDYNPTVNDHIISLLGELNEENLFVLVTVTVPRNIDDMAVNLKAPIIINTNSRKGFQLIVEDDYPVKFKIYQLLKDRKEKAGE